MGAIKAAPVPYQFGLDSFPIDSEWHENDFALEAADAGASECDIMHL